MKEALLAYCFLLAESSQAYDEARLDERISWLNERFGVDVDFEVDDALDKLRKLDLLRTEADGTLNVVPETQALEQLRAHWRGLNV